MSPETQSLAETVCAASGVNRRGSAGSAARYRAWVATFRSKTSNARTDRRRVAVIPQNQRDRKRAPAAAGAGIRTILQRKPIPERTSNYVDLCAPAVESVLVVVAIEIRVVE